MFNPQTVNSAVGNIRYFGSDKKLGKPVRMLTHEEPLWVGVEFCSGERSVVKFCGPMAEEDFAETKRRIEEWMAA